MGLLNRKIPDYMYEKSNLVRLVLFTALFELVFTLGDKAYRYGFEFDRTSIKGDWLYNSNIGGKREKALFVREGEDIGVNEKLFQEGIDMEKNTNNNRLFLSLCAQLGGTISKQNIAAFKDIGVISGIHSEGYSGYSKIMLHNHLDGYAEAIKFFDKMQLGFKSLETEEQEFDMSSLPSDMPDDIKEQLAKELKG